MRLSNSLNQLTWNNLIVIKTLCRYNIGEHRQQVYNHKYCRSVIRHHCLWNKRSLKSAWDNETCNWAVSCRVKAWNYSVKAFLEKFELVIKFSDPTWPMLVMRTVKTYMLWNTMYSTSFSRNQIRVDPFSGLVRTLITFQSTYYQNFHQNNKSNKLTKI